MFVVSRAGPNIFKDAMLLNGSTHPAAAPLRVGDRYRFHVINITPSDDEVALSVLDGGNLVRWLPVAKDGADLPAFYRKSCDAKQKFGAGESYDFEFRPEKSGSLSLQAEFINLKTVLPMDVSDAREISRK